MAHVIPDSLSFRKQYPGTFSEERLKAHEREKSNYARIQQLRAEWNKKAYERNNADNQLKHDTTILWHMNRGGLTTYLRTALNSAFKLYVWWKSPARDPDAIVQHFCVPLDSLPNDQWELRRMIRRILGGIKKVNARENGVLIGLKCLAFGSAINSCMLRSPSRNTFWNGGSLTAHERPADHNLAGIHAVWPRRDRRLILDKELHPYYSDYNGILVEVRGHGVCVLGEKGWRAEKVTAVKAVIPHRFSVAFCAALVSGLTLMGIQTVHEEEFPNGHR